MNDIVARPTPGMREVYDQLSDLHRKMLNLGIAPKYVTMHPTIYEVFETNGFGAVVATPYGNLDIDIRKYISADSIYVTAEKFPEDQPHE